MKIARLLIGTVFLCIMMVSCDMFSEGACVVPFAGSTICYDDRMKSDCDGSSDEFYADTSCSSLGYTSDGFKENGSGSTDADGSGAETGGTTPFTFTCAGSGEQTVNIPNGSCYSYYQTYTKVTVCNEADRFKSACTSLYTCLANNSSGSDKAYYEGYLDTCNAY